MEPTPLVTTARHPASAPKTRGRRGNMTVTALLLVLGMMVMSAGIDTMLNEQIRQAGAVQKIGLGKLQSYYLAEMGLNHVMFTANQNPDATPNPFPVTQVAGQAQQFNFKPNIAMVRNEAAGVATCSVTYQSGTATSANFLCAAHLFSQGQNYDRVIQFAVHKKSGTGGLWVLAGYTVVK